MNYVVFDVGGTEIKYSLMHRDATVLCGGSVPTPLSGAEDFFAVLGNLYRQLGGGRADIAGIAMSLPGIIDSERGFCRTGGALGYNVGQPVAAQLAERCRCPVHIENDGKCAALAEYTGGQLQGCQNAAVCLLGTGVGGGLILGGTLVKGLHFSAGEFSFLSTDAARWGSNDAMLGVSGAVPTLLAAVRAAVGAPEEQPFNGHDAFRYINAGHEGAVATLTRYCRNLAVQFYNLQILLDVEKIAVGGGIGSQPVLVETLRRCYAELFETAADFVRTTLRPTAEIVPCRYGSEANQVGALQSFLAASEGR